MLQVLFLLGLALVFTALLMLIYLIFKARGGQGANEEARQNRIKTLLAINFGAIALATLGLMMVFLSFVLKS